MWSHSLISINSVVSASSLTVSADVLSPVCAWLSTTESSASLFSIILLESLTPLLDRVSTTIFFDCCGSSVSLSEKARFTKDTIWTVFSWISFRKNWAFTFFFQNTHALSTKIVVKMIRLWFQLLIKLEKYNTFVSRSFLVELFVVWPLSDASSNIKPKTSNFQQGSSSAVLWRAVPITAKEHSDYLSCFKANWIWELKFSVFDRYQGSHQGSTG